MTALRILGPGLFTLKALETDRLHTKTNARAAQHSLETPCIALGGEEKLTVEDSYRRKRLSIDIGNGSIEGWLVFEGFGTIGSSRQSG